MESEVQNASGSVRQMFWSLYFGRSPQHILRQVSAWTHSLLGNKLLGRSSSFILPEFMCRFVVLVNVLIIKKAMLISARQVTDLMLVVILCLPTTSFT